MARARRTFPVVVSLCLTLGVVPAVVAGPASAATAPTALEYLHTHGYLPIHGPDSLERAKAWSAAHLATAPETAAAGGRAATVLQSFKGITNTSVSPLDANGAIGPSGYVEIINTNIALYKRTGTMLATSTLGALTGLPQADLSDPMTLWDPGTQRFYYNVWDTATAKMAWGFSKTSNPTSFTNTFCNYSNSFGYPTSTLPDYPKLGQSTGFLMIGVNVYDTPSALHASRSDLLYINKPQGSAPVTTCPAASNFAGGKFTDLRHQDGSQAFTPMPAIQTDPSSSGFVTAMSDIECPDICGNGALLTEYTVTPSATNPQVAQLSPPRSVAVPVYTSPPPAPQKGSTKKVDTLDGRLTHSVSGVDPLAGGATTVWVAHTVAGGAGSEVRWYEVNPAGPGSIVQTASVSNPSLFVFNAGISNDRTVNPTGAAHGSDMALGVTTSSATTDPTVQMVTKVGLGPQSPLVSIKASTKADNDFSCAGGTCRWGDYGGATPDPAASLTAASGGVWLTNMWTSGTLQSWNWEAQP